VWFSEDLWFQNEEKRRKTNAFGELFFYCFLGELRVNLEQHYLVIFLMEGDLSRVAMSSKENGRGRTFVISQIQYPLAHLPASMQSRQQGSFQYLPHEETQLTDRMSLSRQGLHDRSTIFVHL